MKKKIIAAFLCISFLLAVGCSNGETAKVLTKKTSSEKKQSNIQYVLSFNPVITIDDGTVSGLKNDIASSMAKDVKSKSVESLYSDSNWSWIYNDGTSWTKRLIRSVDQWRNDSGESGKGVPYAYEFNDSYGDSLAPYDISKLSISGYSDDIVSQGVLMSFIGSYEEAVCYKATGDCTLSVSDTAFGKISLIKKVSSLDTDTVSKTKANIVIKVKKNNTTMWQGVINGETTSVDFPEIDNVAMSADDCILITVSAVDSLEPDFKTGYVTVPTDDTTKTVKKPYTTSEKILITEEQNKQSAEDSVPFLNDIGECNYTIIRPKELSSEFTTVISSLRSKMSSALETKVEFKNDSVLSTEGRSIYVYKTSFKGSNEALEEISKGRSNNQADFIIRAYGNDLVIAANTKSGLELAFDYFMKNCCTGKKAVISKNYNYVSSEHNKMKDIKINGNNISKYDIVVSHVASYIETAAANYLLKEIASLTGYELKIVNDYTKQSQYEIVIGDTNRGNANYSLLASSSVNNDYKIKVENSKLFVTGNQVYGANAGAIKLAEFLNTKTDFERNFSYSGVYDGGYSLTDGYKLTWADEFNGTKRARTWEAQSGVERGVGYLGGDKYTLASNITLKDGTLNMHTYTKEENGKINQYGAGMTSTGPEAMWHKYGYAEVRVKFAKTKGVCNSFWTKASLVTEFLETDIYETFGDPNNAKCNLHTWGPTGHRNLLGGTGGILNLSPGTSVAEPYGNEFHTFGWEWTDDIINFYYDGVLNTTFDCTSSTYDSFNKAAYYIISCDISVKDYGVLPDGNRVDDITSYDWFRLYQKEDNDSTLLVKK